MNKEEIYDAEIAPLMSKIIAICQANEIAFIASFALPTEEDWALMCTTALLDDEYQPPAELRQALGIIVEDISRTAK